jgi:hypothetical protein
MLEIIIVIVYTIFLLLVIFYIFNEIRDIILINRCRKEFKRICDDFERWGNEVNVLDLLYEHSSFLSGYRYLDKPSEQLKYINDYRQKLINKYKHNIPSMLLEHRSKRLKQILK